MVWSLVFDIACESPIRFAHLLRSGSAVRWGLADGSERLTSRSARVTFHPTDWLGSDEVHVMFGSSLSVSDEELKADPRSLVTIHAPEAATGEAVVLAELPRHGIEFGVIVFAHNDTEDRRRGRWRVRPELRNQLPEYLGALTSGFQAGNASL